MEGSGSSVNRIKYSYVAGTQQLPDAINIDHAEAIVVSSGRHISLDNRLFFDRYELLLAIGATHQDIEVINEMEEGERGPD